MSESGADERTKRSWGSGTHRSSAGGRYVASGVFGPVTHRGEEDTHAAAGIGRQGHESDIVFVVKRDSTVLHASFPDHRAPVGGVVGRAILGFFAQEFAADIIRSFENAFAFSEPQSFVCCGNPPLAVGSWYRCRVSPNHGESGVDSATVFVRDITEWKHNEGDFRAEIDTLRSQIAELSSENENLTDLLATREQREEELSRFRDIMNHAGEAIFITDPHTGRFVDVNETACRWLRCSRDKLLQMGVGDLDLEFPLESSDGEVEHVADTRDAFRPKALVLGSHRRRNGTSFPVEVTISPRLFGDRDFLLVVARDVKQRSRTERAFLEGENERRGLSEISRDAVYCTARDGTVCEVNDSALDLFGYTRDEFLGLEARRLFLHREDIDAFKRAVEEDGAVKNVRTEFKAKSGRWFEGFLGATLRFDADGGVQGYQCIISVDDIAGVDVDRVMSQAERAKLDAEEARKRADALHREVERAKQEFHAAKSEAATMRADVEQAMLQVAKAKSDAEEARERAETLAREVELANSDVAEARSEADKARADVERSVLDVAQAKLDAKEAQERADALKREAGGAKRDKEEATERATRAEADAETARLEIEKAKLEIGKAKLDAEQAKAETAKARADAEQAKAESAKARADAEEARAEAAVAMLDAEEATNRVQQLEREAEKRMTDTQKAVHEAAKACADLERAKAEAPVSPSIVGRRMQPLVAPDDLHRNAKEPELWPKRSSWPAVWLAVFVIAVVALAAVLLAL